jgi:peptidoglycan/LPS O-acetylase OafA/YrhL
MNFRTDINGMRAIAVIAVVLYHFSVPHFGGGFLGVDVFFVISGFLMTDIILRGIHKGSFSILSFYKYRARRIVPALAVLCTVLLVAGWFVLLPSEFRALGKQAAASIGFFSNISFWREAGYFDVRSLDKWFLHTWSLSVEWQFYLLYPLVLVALTKWLPAAWLRGSIIAATVISLVICIYLSAPNRWPTAAFYLLPTRAWEMLAGALVYLYPLRASARTRAALEWTGLALIAFGLMRFNARLSWPGWHALVPVAGTALIIAAARSNSWATGSTAAQFIGKISYSVYLWHWPVVVAISYYGKTTHPIWVGVGIVASFVFGYLSWKLVESRTHGKSTAAHTFVPFVPLRVTLALALLVFVAGGALYYRQGVPERFDHSVFVADEETYDTNPHRSVCHMLLDPCDVYKTQLKSRAVIIGDSHAEALSEALNAAVPNGKRGDVILIAVQGCPTIDGVRRDNGECFEANRKYIALLGKASSKEPPVVIVNHWSEYTSGETASRLSFVDPARPKEKGVPFSIDQYDRRFLSTMCALAKARPVYLVEPVPEFDVNVPNALARAKLSNPGAPDLTLDMAEYYKRNSHVLNLMREARDQCGVQLLDPTPYLCSNGKCLGSYQGRPLYSDMHHMSEYGNRFLVPMFRKVFAVSQ